MDLPLLGSVSDTLLVVLFLLICIYIYGTSYVGVWEKVGVPGPKPWPIIDHALQLRHGLDHAFDKWHAQYGRTFGIYGFRPRTATLMTTDIHLVNHILVKDFSNFTDRYFFKMTESSMIRGLFFLNGGIWKRHRHLMSHMFTGGKLKLMFQHADDTAASLVQLIKQYKADGNLIPVKDLAARYASDVISKSGFGLDGHAVSSEDSEFYYHINRFLRLGTPAAIAYLTISLFFPSVGAFLMKIFPAMDLIYPEAEAYFTGLAETALRRKQELTGSGQSSSKVKDMIDLFLEVEVDEGTQLNEDTRGMTRKEIIGNSVLFIFAAYETTSTALTNVLYCLARYPDVQNKVLQEIDGAMRGQSGLDYDKLAELTYTEQVIKEALRRYPPVSNVQRMPLETKEYEGVVIPKGTNVYIPIAKIMNDPEYWLEPDRFDPDRFSVENRSDLGSVTFLPFGFGPRQCIGKRLAMIELKVVLCHLLSSMKFIQSERTEPKLGHDVVMTTLGRTDFPVPEKPIMLNVELRDD